VIPDEVRVIICCPHCGHDIFKIFDSPAEPPLSLRTAPSPSTPVENRHPADRTFSVSTPVDDTG
jgi:hypothetical protein